MQDKLITNNMLFIIPSWGVLLGYPTLGKYVSQDISRIHSDFVVFLTGIESSVGIEKGTLHFLFGLGYYYTKFELQHGKYIIDKKQLTGLILSDFVYDHMATSKNITLESDRDVIISEKVIKVPIDLSNKSDTQKTFIKGTLMRNVFIPNKDIILDMMDEIRKPDTYLLDKLNKQNYKVDYKKTQYYSEIQSLKEKWFRFLDDFRDDSKVPVMISTALKEIRKFFKRDAIMVTSSGNVQAQMLQELPFYEP
ncbi:unnamed protein product, partial [marine sediment metagenome]